jgi:hypothetical protein
MLLRIVAIAALFVPPFQAPTPAKPATAAETLPDAREIVNKHIKALGGREAILAHKSMRAVGTLSVPASGIEGPLEMIQAAEPNRMMLKTSVPGIGEILEGFDGSHAWSVNPMTGAMLKVGKELTQTKFDADFYKELYDPKNYTLKTVEKTTCPAGDSTPAGNAGIGRPCYKVAVSRIDGVEDTDFYDVETGLRAGSIATRESPMGQMTMTSVETGYKKFGNLMQATIITQTVMGVTQKITLTSVEYDTVKPGDFELPPSIKALIK